MKKILYFFGFLTIGFIIFYNYKPIVIKYILGSAIILNKKTNYTVSIEGIKHENVLYEDTNKLILFLKNKNISKEYSILSIEMKNNVVGYNCSSNECYDTFLGNLYQSDMGKMFVFLSDKYKGPNFDSELKINENNIEFYIPKKVNEKIHVQLILNDPCQ
jgi:hypothetical protein